MMAPTIVKNLWTAMPKWSDDSAFRKTKDCRMNTLVTFATQALEKGRLLVTRKVLDTHTWVSEMSGLLVTVKVLLKVQTYICNVLRKIFKLILWKRSSFTEIEISNLARNDLRYCDISFTGDLTVINNCTIHQYLQDL